MIPDSSTDKENTDDLRVRDIQELTPPEEILRLFPLSGQAKAVVAGTRQDIHRILHGADDRLVIIIGPCSIHDVKAAREYGDRLLELRRRFADSLVVLMRVY